MRLLRVELRRFFSRRAVVILVVIGALAVGAIAAGVLYENRPVSDGERAAAVAEAERYNSDRWVTRGVERCEARGTPTEMCEQRYFVDSEDLLYRSQLNVADFKFWLIPMAGVAAAVALLLGSTFIGADFSSGSIGTQLVFEPRRLRVWSAKTAGVAVGSGAFAAVTLGIANGVILLAAKAWDRPLRDGLLADMGGATGRGVLLVIAAGVGGYAIAVLSRHTSAALGLIAVYGIAGEAVVRAIWPGSERWLLSNHLVAWVGGTWRQERFDDCLSGPCVPTVIEFTPLGAATYLGLLALGVAVASLLVFRRRDVA